MSHFDKFSILTDKQHGFRSKHSCESQLILTIHDLAKCLDKKSQIDMAIMDFSKAFDSVPHNWILFKLTRLGIKNQTHRYQAQRVVVGGEHSTWTDVVSGVPQGTVLGPLLFLTYINDFPDNLKSSVRLFAGDCVLYHEIQNEIDSEELQSDLDTLVQWEKDWQLSFNPSKCHIMRLTHARSPKHFEYKLGNSVLSETDGHPYLGVHISNKLSWNSHIHQISSKANRTLGFIMRNFYSCPKHVKESAYKTLVRPLLEYSSAGWAPYTKNLTNQIEKVQKRAARFVSNDFTSRSEGCVTEMIQSLEWTSLADRRKVRRISILQQARLDHLSLPSETSCSLSNVNHAISIPTPTQLYQLIRTATNKYSYFPRTIIDWNFLPEHLTQIELIPQFKEAVTIHLQATKQQQD